MNHDRFVSVDFVLSLNLIKNITTDKAFLVKIMKQSDLLFVDEEEEMVRPTFKAHERNTLILRDIPKNFKEEEVKKLFEEKVSAESLEVLPK